MATSGSAGYVVGSGCFRLNKSSIVFSLWVVLAALLLPCLTEDGWADVERKCLKGSNWSQPDYTSDCRKWYYLCQDGQLAKGHCRQGHQFDPYRGRCVNGFKSFCISPTMEMDCNKSLAWTRPDPYECSTVYYQCHDGLLKRLRCQSGSQFDEASGQCEEGYRSNCIFPVEARDCVEGAAWTLPNPVDCKNEYYRCLDGEFTYWKCRNGSQYSPLKRKCIKGYVTECPRSIMAKDCKEEDQWIKPDPFFCAYRFFTCNNGTFRTISCEEGYQVNIGEGKCVEGYTSDCNQTTPDEINKKYLDPRTW